MSTSELSPKQKVYCQARAEGLNVSKSADRAGVVLETASRWNRDPAIWEHIEQLQEFAAKGALRVLRARAERAAERVGELIEPGYNVGNSADVNLRAALATLKFIGAEPAEKKELTGKDGKDLFDADAPLTKEDAASILAMLEATSNGGGR
jgi:hypothetical protein